MIKSIQKENLITPKRGYLIGNLLTNYSSWVLVAFLVLVGSILSKSFLTPLNFSNLFSQVGILGLLALSQSICLFTGNMDLSIEENMVFCATIGTWLTGTSIGTSGWQLNGILTIVIMIIIGGFVGLLNGSLIAYFEMNPFMCTLSISLLVKGGTLFLFRGPRLYGLPEVFTFLGGERIGIVPFPLIALIVVFFIFHVIMTRTIFGRSLYAVGGNRTAARASGIDDRLIIFSAYILSGAISGFAGAALAGRLDAAFHEMSSGQLFLAFAAAVIGGVSLQGGVGTLLGIFGGAMVMITASNIMNLSVQNEYLIELAVGLIILAAVVLDNFRLKLSERI